jgi:uncharacterized membrane-anchored protein YhcB (DUF1043 family)
LDLIKEKLIQKEGIEKKLEDYKSKFDNYKDAIEQKNKTLLLLKD